MARPREFDFDAALNKATNLFWSRGYFDTSTRDIVEHLELGRQSIYNAFGDKEALFGRCLRHYEETVLEPRLSGLESKSAGRREIVRFLAQTVDFLDTQPNNRSCMMSIVAPNASHQIKGAASAVSQFHQRLCVAFQEALLNLADVEGSASSVDKKMLSHGLSCTIHGMAVVSKIGGTREDLVDIASIALQPLY